MNNDMRSMIVGGAIVAVVFGGVLGLWSMTVAPAPPSVQVARAQENAVKQEVQGHMREFISNWRRTQNALGKNNRELAAAHLMVMDELADDLQEGRLGHKIPAEQIQALRTALGGALTAVKAGDPNARDTVVNIKNQCMACHATQNGPSPTIFEAQ
jgi:hypothetical protein